MANLYKIEKKDENLYILKPANSTAKESATVPSAPTDPTVIPAASKPVDITPPSNNSSTQINLISKYRNWAVSPIINSIFQKDLKIPDIRLKEKRMISSTLWEQFKYFAIAGTTTVDVLINKIGEKFESAKESAEKAKEAAAKQNNIATGLLDLLNVTQNQRSNDPYDGIYSLEDTGFEYVFPFYTREMRSKSACYSDTYSGDGKGLIETGVNALKDFTETHAQGYRGLVEPGLYIEKTQFYNFDRNQESISFSFPLLNTMSPEQISENYQILFLLLYQNSMFRKDRAAFIPPCIYELLIPGIRYIKYAYISTLSVEFLGTRRVIEINAPAFPTGNKFKTIIPEAYKVNMTITGLHDEVGNFLEKSDRETFS